MATIDEIDAQIRALEEQKKQIQQKAKDAALGKANAAIEELRKLGYNYRLVEGAGNARSASTGGGTRRTGQRDNVLALIKMSKGGISAADVLVKMEAGTDAEKTSIRNALAALKRNGTVDIKDGNYIAK
jgi:hypothetical protein